MCDVLNSDRQLSVQMIAEYVGIDKMTVHTIITEDLHLQMRKMFQACPESAKET